MARIFNAVEENCIPHHPGGWKILAVSPSQNSLTSPIAAKAGSSKVAVIIRFSLSRVTWVRIFFFREFSFVQGFSSERIDSSQQFSRSQSLLGVERREETLEDSWLAAWIYLFTIPSYLHPERSFAYHPQSQSRHFLGRKKAKTKLFSSPEIPLDIREEKTSMSWHTPPQFTK